MTRNVYLQTVWQFLLGSHYLWYFKNLVLIWDIFAFILSLTKYLLSAY